MTASPLGEIDWPTGWLRCEVAHVGDGFKVNMSWGGQQGAAAYFMSCLPAPSSGSCSQQPIPGDTLFRCLLTPCDTLPSRSFCIRMSSGMKCFP
jgi:hypothetical protein